MLLKNEILTTEQVSTICAGQGIDVNDVCSAAFDQPTPRTRGTPKGAMRGAGGAKRPPDSVQFQGGVGPAPGDLTPAQTPSLSSALDSMLENIYTPVSEPPE
jgi:hypothetical protein